MAEPEKYPFVVCSGMFVVVAGQIIFGILGFICFEFHTAPIITYVTTLQYYSNFQHIVLSKCMYLILFSQKRENKMGLVKRLDKSAVAVNGSKHVQSVI